MSVQVFGQRIIILNSHEHAVNLLNERSAIYSDRQSLTLAGSMVGWDHILVLRRYGHEFREIRQLFHQFIGTRNKVVQYYPCVDAEAGQFLVQLLHKPKDFAKHIRKSVTKSEFYGKNANSRLMDLTELLVRLFWLCPMGIKLKKMMTTTSSISWTRVWTNSRC